MLSRLSCSSVKGLLRRAFHPSAIALLYRFLIHWTPSNLISLRAMHLLLSSAASRLAVASRAPSRPRSWHQSGPPQFPILSLLTLLPANLQPSIAYQRPYRLSSLWLLCPVLIARLQLMGSLSLLGRQPLPLHLLPKMPCQHTF